MIEIFEIEDNFFYIKRDYNFSVAAVTVSVIVEILIM